MMPALWLACTAFLAHFILLRVPESCQDAVIAWSIVALVIMAPWS
ncbi:MAG: hypothetical protein ACOYNN_18385 [Terrimicrobiaceae bacterium]